MLSDYQYLNVTKIIDMYIVLAIKTISGRMASVLPINVFINSDAILNRDALWSIQGKKHCLQAAIVGGIHHTGKILR